MLNSGYGESFVWVLLKVSFQLAEVHRAVRQAEACFSAEVLCFGFADAVELLEHKDGRVVILEALREAFA